MTRTAISAILLAAFGMATSTAMAADMPLKAPPAIAPALFSWTGFYAGVNGGYSWGQADPDVTFGGSTRTRVFRAFGTPAETLTSDVTVAAPAIAARGRADVTGWVAGVQGGHNWQLNPQWVVGVEADFQGTGERGDVTLCSTAGCPAGSVFTSANYRLSWFGTVRGRAGFLVTPRVWIYGTGGLAYGHLETNYAAGIVAGPSSVFSADKTKLGWVAGAGVEGAVTDNWLLRLEYLYMDLGNFAGGAAAAATTTVLPNVPNQGFTTVIDTTANAAVNSRFTDHILRAALSYKF